MDQSAYFEQMRNKRKQEILEAARHMMLIYGPDAFNMQQLARTLDISTVTLYKYYKNSDDIVIALQEDILQEMELLWSIIPSGTKEQSSLMAYLTNVYMVALEHRTAMTLLFLFDVHNRFLDDEAKLKNPFFAYDGTFYQTLCMLIDKNHPQSTSDILSQKAHFIQNLFTAQIRHIALMEDSLWEEHKKQWAKQIHAFETFLENYLNE